MLKYFAGQHLDDQDDSWCLAESRRLGSDYLNDIADDFIFNHDELEAVIDVELTIRFSPRCAGSRYGVCYKRSNGSYDIMINPRLLLFEEVVIAKTVLHELCHIIYFDHSNEFWQLYLKVGGQLAVDLYCCFNVGEDIEKTVRRFGIEPSYVKRSDYWVGVPLTV